MKEGLGDFGLLGDTLHFLHEGLGFPLLLLDLLSEFATLHPLLEFVLGALAARACLGPVLHGFAEFFLGLGHFTSLFAHGFHVLAELARGFFLKVLACFLELIFCFGGGGGCLGEFLLLKLFHCFGYLFSRSVQLLFCLGHVVCILGLLHALTGFVKIAKELLLLVLKTFELLGELVPFLLALGLCHLLLEVFDFLGQGFLSSGEFFQAVEDLEVLLLLG